MGIKMIIQLDPVYHASLLIAIIVNSRLQTDQELEAFITHDEFTVADNQIRQVVFMLAVGHAVELLSAVIAHCLRRLG